MVLGSYCSVAILPALCPLRKHAVNSKDVDEACQRRIQDFWKGGRGGGGGGGSNNYIHKLGVGTGGEGACPLP